MAGNVAAASPLLVPAAWTWPADNTCGVTVGGACVGHETSKALDMSWPSAAIVSFTVPAVVPSTVICWLVAGATTWADTTPLTGWVIVNVIGRSPPLLAKMRLIVPPPLTQ